MGPENPLFTKNSCDSDVNPLGCLLVNRSFLPYDEKEDPIGDGRLGETRAL